MGMRRVVLAAFVAIVTLMALSLASCGGGGSGKGLNGNNQGSGGGSLGIVTVTLATGTVGTAYNAPITAAGGSGAGYTWTLTAGALPAGLTGIPGSGATVNITGTPTVSGTVSFTARVADSSGASSSKQFSITINPVSTPGALTITTTSLISGLEGAPYSDTLDGTGGSGAGYTWALTAGALPTGITGIPGAGASITLSGTPTVQGQFDITVQLTDSAAATTSAQFSILILGIATPGNLEVITNAVDDATINVAYSFDIQAQGGQGPYTWTMDPRGELPPGITGISTTPSQSTPNITLSGTPTQTGTWTIIFGVEDVNGQSAAGSFAMRVLQTPQSANTWAATATTDAPTARWGHAAAWSGEEMLIISGDDGTAAPGHHAYDYETDTWRELPAPPFSFNRKKPASVWNGDSLIVWSGLDSGGGNDTTGLIYTPQTGTPGTWATMSQVGVPEGRNFASAVWANFDMVVWGGNNSDFNLPNPVDTGGRYNAATDTWQPTSTTNAPSARYGHSAVWSGAAMIVWGGMPFSLNLASTNTGGVYDPSVDIWTPGGTNTTGAPVARTNHSAVWTGTVMLIFGGSSFAPSGAATDYNDVWQYDPAGAGTWTQLSADGAAGAPTRRSSATAIWNGTSLIVFGGRRLSQTGAASMASGGAVFTPGTGWSAIPVANDPGVRTHHSAVWTGDRMITWGGADFSASATNPALLATGGIFRP